MRSRVFYRRNQVLKSDIAFTVRKAFAETVAGVIPNKMARNRWRGILRYGLIRAGVLMYRMQKVKSSPKHYLTICVIVKNEGSYFVSDDGKRLQLTLYGSDEEVEGTVIYTFTRKDVVVPSNDLVGKWKYTHR